ncbi:MarR family winged helix-turn-helix transcriptional regulator [Kribbella pratensis]|uniref:DNA-binding MarR family transcriptional regulator n=1 Tax=Kribbella pratensis TaxID=2512112 RepID=A0A4R8CGE9_9ACTN|nr:MarR family transcriptional regulator [Kribbella pratensis]TDW75382.1 DNA-binding MarR family transcriptional regulator [Kribbella pratensis]
MTETRVLDDLLCFDLYSLSRMVTALYRPVLDPHGLTYPQYLVLVTLTRLGPCSIGDIARATRLDHGTLTPLLRRLADRGLLTLDRSATDARSVTVALTPEGESLKPVLHEAQCHLGNALGLTEPQVRRLQSTLHQLADHLDNRSAD